MEMNLIKYIDFKLSELAEERGKLSNEIKEINRKIMVYEDLKQFAIDVRNVATK